MAKQVYFYTNTKADCTQSATFILCIISICCSEALTPDINGIFQSLAKECTSYKGAASRSYQAPWFLCVILPSFLLHLRNTSGTRESIKCSKGFMEPEIWMLTHRDTTMQLSLSMIVWVVPKHSTNIYAEITEFCVGEEKSGLEKRAFDACRLQWVLNCPLPDGGKKIPEINLLI